MGQGNLVFQRGTRGKNNGAQLSSLPILRSTANSDVWIEVLCVWSLQSYICKKAAPTLQLFSSLFDTGNHYNQDEVEEHCNKGAKRDKYNPSVVADMLTYASRIGMRRTLGSNQAHRNT
jgi:hypothetical protein